VLRSSARSPDGRLGLAFRQTVLGGTGVSIGETPDCQRPAGQKEERKAEKCCADETAMTRFGRGLRNGDSAGVDEDGVGVALYRDSHGRRLADNASHDHGPQRNRRLLDCHAVDYFDSVVAPVGLGSFADWPTNLELGLMVAEVDPLLEKNDRGANGRGRRSRHGGREQEQGCSS
jgi:hypothetical protein